MYIPTSTGDLNNYASNNYLLETLNYLFYILFLIYNKKNINKHIHIKKSDIYKNKEQLCTIFHNELQET